MAKTGKERGGRLWHIVEEVCFIILPFIVMGIVKYSRGKLGDLANEPEWSVIAAVLCGQTIIRFTKLTIGMTARYNVDRSFVSACIAALLALVLVPSLTLLTLIVGDESKPIEFVRNAQVLVFAVSVSAFIFVLYIERTIDRRHGTKG